MFLGKEENCNNLHQRKRKSQQNIVTFANNNGPLDASAWNLAWAHIEMGTSQKISANKALDHYTNDTPINHANTTLNGQ